MKCFTGRRQNGKTIPQAQSLAYLPQLDAVRAFAVSLVVWHHWCGPADGPLGPIGVWIFFVLSGFLITRILLTSRSETPWENRRALATFYVRRFLRIFPLYYFVLLLSFAASAAFRLDWPWYAAYLQNFKMMRADDGSIFGIHLWSLAVEEQFYVFWPLIVFFAPRFLLLPTICFAMALAVVSRCVFTQLGWTPFQVYVFTPDSFDTLALGALLAYVTTHRPERAVWLRRIALGAAAALLGGTSLLRNPILEAGLLSLPTGLIAFWAVSHAAAGVGGLFGRLLSFSPSIYLGRISYGIYVYHFFVPTAIRPLLARFHIEEGGASFLAVCCVVTVAIASLSWFLLERPINSLKNRFVVAAPRG